MILLRLDFLAAARKPVMEGKRLPLHKPSCKHNVHNKITRSDGTSH